MTTPELETERLILRKIHADDVAAVFYGWMHDEAVSRYMWWKAADDIGAAEEFITFELENLENDQWNRWIITQKSTGAVIGTCLIFYNSEEVHWDISYNLGSRFWGHGYATEAMRAVLRYAREVLKVSEISTVYAKENTASGRVLQKLNFQVVREVPYECGGGDILTTGYECICDMRE